MSDFLLEVTTDPGHARFRLLDPGGAVLASRALSLAELPTSRWELLLEPLRAVRRAHTEGRSEDDLMGEVSAFLAEVLGPEIVNRIGNGVSARSLEVRLPSGAGDAVAVALARVPWELARTSAGRTLFAQNVALRLSIPEAVVAAPLQLGADGILRVVMVFAASSALQPLALRQERVALLRMLHDEVLPNRRVEVEVLAHGVTRDALFQAFSAPVHLLHWSGHGGHDALEIEAPDGAPDHLSGQDLLDLMVDAGGNLPALVVLGACSTASTLGARDWSELFAALRDREAAEVLGGEAAPAGPGPAGYAGVAAALLATGIPAVVAMRAAVGDAAARALSLAFYRKLLGSGQPADRALHQARRDVERQAREGLAGVGPLDLFMPVLFSAGNEPVCPPEGRAPQLDRWDPQPQPLLPDGRRDLLPRAVFVGRSADLGLLARDWLAGADHPVAVVQGLPGQGKTALAAELIDLFHPRFSAVLAFQPRPDPIPAEELYRRVHGRLLDASPAYLARTRKNPARAVFLDDPRPDRWERMRDNLVAALREEAVLLVLDNFETNQEDLPKDGRFACRDPEWDRILNWLGRDLPGSRARVLLTTRRRVAAEAGVLWLPLGPLPIGEAALLARELPPLQRLIAGDGADRAAVQRALALSRGHPLLIARLASLATDRAALDSALDALDTHGYAGLPDLFAGSGDRAAEHAYLEDLSGAAVDLLIRRCCALARRLLWVMTRADEPLTYGVVRDLWSGITRAADVADKSRKFLEVLAASPEKDSVPEEQREVFARFATRPLPAHPLGEPSDPLPLLEELYGAGLLFREDSAPPTWSWHPLIRERVDAWVAAHPLDRGDREEREIWRLLGDEYQFGFEERLTSGDAGARGHAVEAGVRALAYWVRAGEGIGEWVLPLISAAQGADVARRVAGLLVRATQGFSLQDMDRKQLVILAAAMIQADVVARAYELLIEARRRAGAARDSMLDPWIYRQLGFCAYRLGDLAKAREHYEAALDSARRLPASPLDLRSVQVDALRVDFDLCEAESIRRTLDDHLSVLRDWWARRQAGELVEGAMDRDSLGTILLGVLDMARKVAEAAERWDDALQLGKEAEQVGVARGEPESALVRIRLRQVKPLAMLGRGPEAKRLLDACTDEVDISAESPWGAFFKVQEAWVWSALGDRERAVACGRRAIDVSTAMDIRIEAHHLLSQLLPPPESDRHLLAAFAFSQLAGGHGQMDCVRALRGRRTSDAAFALGPVEDLLALPEFDPLRRAIEAKGASLANLAAQIARVADPSFKPSVGRSVTLS